MKNNNYIKKKKEELEILYELIENEEKVDDKDLISKEILKIETQLSNFYNKNNKNSKGGKIKNKYYINKKYKEKKKKAHLSKCKCNWCKESRKERYKFDENWNTSYFLEEDFVTILDEQGFEVAWDYLNSEDSMIPVYKHKSKNKYKKIKLIKKDESKTTMLVREKDSLDTKLREFTELHLTFKDLETGKKLKVNTFKEFMSIEIKKDEIYKAREIFKELFNVKYKMLILKSFI